MVGIWGQKLECKVQADAIITKSCSLVFRKIAYDWSAALGEDVFRFSRRYFLTALPKAACAAGLLNLKTPIVPEASAQTALEATPSEIDAWMRAWMTSTTKDVSGPLFLSRFVEPVYFLIAPITWVPNPGEEVGVQEVKVPIGFVTDLASIPRPFFSLLRPDGAYTFPAIVHDYLYWTQTIPRDKADLVFKYGMQDFGVGAVTIATLYESVSIGGGAAWAENARLKKNGERRLLKRWPTDPRTRWADWKMQPNVFQI